MAKLPAEATLPRTLEATTLANSQHEFLVLASNVVQHLRHVLAGNGSKLNRASLDDTEQTPQPADGA